jgi:GNAT superfamily N-acetyltransferase
LLKIRHAKQSDKRDVLRFCIDTFEWGDYIDQVWDIWYSDQKGYLMVAEDKKENCTKRHSKNSSLLSSVITAVSHVYLCPNKNSIWLEGIRVRPDYRLRSIATELIKKMVRYGEEQGAKEAAAIVSANNTASRLMMEKNGFVVISKWNYYGTDKIPEKSSIATVRIATSKDIDSLCNYLKQSQIFKSAGESYVNSWRWCPLDVGSDSLQNLIEDERVIVIGNGDYIMNGVAIINKDNNKTFQIVYLDASNALMLKYLVKFVTDWARTEIERYKRIQIFTPHMTYVDSVMEDLGIVYEVGQFLLYKRKI